MFVDKHGQGKGGVLENKNKRATEKFELRREDLMHKLTSLLDFLKMANRPPSGGFFTTYGILLCYANVNVMLNCILINAKLICYTIGNDRL